MRGQIDNLNRVIPGSLIAVRDNEQEPWILSVVRWFRRLMVDYVEIGVEYLGREPRFVKMVTDYDRELATAEAPNFESRCFAALYLPPSEGYPTMPIKTVLLPAREFRRRFGCDIAFVQRNLQDAFERTYPATVRVRLDLFCGHRQGSTASSLRLPIVDRLGPKKRLRRRWVRYD